jgi:cation transport ATPase
MGKPFVTDEFTIHDLKKSPLGTNADQRQILSDLGDNALLFLAAMTEQQNAHPIARAIIQESESRNISLPWLPDGSYKSEIGSCVNIYIFFW